MPIMTLCAISKGASKEEQEEKEVEWDNLALPDSMPYSLLKDYIDGNQLYLTTMRTKQPFVLTANNPRLSDSEETFQERLNKELLRAKANPSYFGLESKQLLENNILIPNPQYTQGSLEFEYLHGPKGFDFSKVTGQAEKRSIHPVQLIVAAQKEEKERNNQK